MQTSLGEKNGAPTGASSNATQTGIWSDSAARKSVKAPKKT